MLRTRWMHACLSAPCYFHFIFRQIVLHAVFSATIDSYLWMIQNDNSDNDSLVPRPLRFFVLRFAFSIIHGSGKA